MYYKKVFQSCRGTVCFVSISRLDLFTVAEVLGALIASCARDLARTFLANRIFYMIALSSFIFLLWLGKIV